MSSKKARKSNQSTEDRGGKSSRSGSPQKSPARLQLVPELVDLRVYNEKKTNPDFVHVGSLYIPKNIVQMVTSEDLVELSSGKGLKEQENIFSDSSRTDNTTEETIEIKDPELRRYIQRIVRYSGFNPEDAVSTVRKASYDIKQKARTSVQKGNNEKQAEVWKSYVDYNQDDSEGSSGDEMDGDEARGKQLVPIEWPVQGTTTTRPTLARHLITRVFDQALALKINFSLPAEENNLLMNLSKPSIIPKCQISVIKLKQNDDGNKSILTWIKCGQIKKLIPLITIQDYENIFLEHILKNLSLTLKNQHDFFDKVNCTLTHKHKCKYNMINNRTKEISRDAIYNYLYNFPKEHKCGIGMSDKKCNGMFDNVLDFLKDNEQCLSAKHLENFWKNTDNIYTDTIKNTFFGTICNNLKGIFNRKCTCEKNRSQNSNERTYNNYNYNPLRHSPNFIKKTQNKNFPNYIKKKKKKISPNLKKKKQIQASSGIPTDENFDPISANSFIQLEEPMGELVCCDEIEIGVDCGRGTCSATVSSQATEQEGKETTAQKKPVIKLSTNSLLLRVTSNDPQVKDCCTMTSSNPFNNATHYSDPKFVSHVSNQIVNKAVFKMGMESNVVNFVQDISKEVNTSESEIHNDKNGLSNSLRLPSGAVNNFDATVMKYYSENHFSISFSKLAKIRRKNIKKYRNERSNEYNKYFLDPCNHLMNIEPVTACYPLIKSKLVTNNNEECNKNKDGYNSVKKQNGGKSGEINNSKLKAKSDKNVALVPNVDTTSIKPYQGANEEKSLLNNRNGPEKHDHKTNINDTSKYSSTENEYPPLIQYLSFENHLKANPHLHGGNTINVGQEREQHNSKDRKNNLLGGREVSSERKHSQAISSHGILRNNEANQCVQNYWNKKDTNTKLHYHDKNKLSEKNPTLNNYYDYSRNQVHFQKQESECLNFKYDNPERTDRTDLHRDSPVFIKDWQLGQTIGPLTYDFTNYEYPPIDINNKDVDAFFTVSIKCKPETCIERDDINISSQRQMVLTDETLQSPNNNLTFRLGGKESSKNAILAISNVEKVVICGPDCINMNTQDIIRESKLSVTHPEPGNHSSELNQVPVDQEYDRQVSTESDHMNRFSSDLSYSNDHPLRASNASVSADFERYSSKTAVSPRHSAAERYSSKTSVFPRHSASERYSNKASGPSRYSSRTSVSPRYSASERFSSTPSRHSAPERYSSKTSVSPWQSALERYSSKTSEMSRHSAPERYSSRTSVSPRHSATEPYSSITSEPSRHSAPERYSSRTSVSPRHSATEPYSSITSEPSRHSAPERYSSRTSVSPRHSATEPYSSITSEPSRHSAPEERSTIEQVETPLQFELHDEVNKKRFICYEIVGDKFVPSHILQPSFHGSTEEEKQKFSQMTSTTNLHTSSNSGNTKSTLQQTSGYSRTHLSSIPSENSVKAKNSSFGDISKSSRYSPSSLNSMGNYEEFGNHLHNQNVVYCSERCSCQGHHTKKSNIQGLIEKTILKNKLNRHSHLSGRSSINYTLTHDHQNPTLRDTYTRKSSKPDELRNKQIQMKKTMDEQNEHGHSLIVNHYSVNTRKSSTSRHSDNAIERNLTQSQPNRKKKTVIWKCKCQIPKGQQKIFRTVKDGASSQKKKTPVKNKKSDPTFTSNKNNIKSPQYKYMCKQKVNFPKKTYRNTFKRIEEKITNRDTKVEDNKARRILHDSKYNTESTTVCMVMLPSENETQIKKVTFMNQPYEHLISHKLNTDNQSHNCIHKVKVNKFSQKTCPIHPTYSLVNSEPHLPYCKMHNTSQFNKKYHKMHHAKVMEPIYRTKKYKIVEKPLKQLYLSNSRNNESKNRLLKNKISNESLIKFYSSETSPYKFQSISEIGTCKLNTRLIRKEIPMIFERKLETSFHEDITNDKHANELYSNKWKKDFHLSNSINNSANSTEREPANTTRNGMRNSLLDWNHQFVKEKKYVSLDAMHKIGQKSFLQDGTIYPCTGRFDQKYIHVVPHITSQDLKNGHCHSVVNEIRFNKTFHDTINKNNRNKQKKNETNTRTRGNSTHQHNIGETPTKMNVTQLSEASMLPKCDKDINFDGLCKENRLSENVNKKVKDGYVQTVYEIDNKYLENSLKTKYYSNFCHLEKNNQLTPNLNRCDKYKGETKEKYVQTILDENYTSNSKKISELNSEPNKQWKLQNNEQIQVETKRQTIKFSGALIFEGQTPKKIIDFTSLSPYIVQETISSFIKNEGSKKNLDYSEESTAKKSNMVNENLKYSKKNLNDNNLYELTLKLPKFYEETKNTSDTGFENSISNKKGHVLMVNSLDECANTSNCTDSEFCESSSRGSDDSSSHIEIGDCNTYIKSTLGVNVTPQDSEEVTSDTYSSTRSYCWPSENPSKIKDKCSKSKGLEKRSRNGKKNIKINDYKVEKLIASSSSELEDLSKIIFDENSSTSLSSYKLITTKADNLTVYNTEFEEQNEGSDENLEYTWLTDYLTSDQE